MTCNVLHNVISPTLFSWPTFHHRINKQPPLKKARVFTEYGNWVIGKFCCKVKFFQRTFRITIDSELRFYEYVMILYFKDYQKPSALTRTANYVAISKQKFFVNSFITEKFDNCPLIWM